MGSGGIFIVVKRTISEVYAMFFKSRAPRSVKNEIIILRRFLENKAEEDDILVRVVFFKFCFMQTTFRSLESYRLATQSIVQMERQTGEK